MEQRDFFGYLPRKWNIKFDGGFVAPLDDWEEREKWINENMHEDGFLYPPISKTMRINPVTMEVKEEIPKTERPALLHWLPASHEICLYDSTGSKEDFRKGVGALIINLLAYLFGTRLQFYEWWIDGRVPIESTHNIHIKKSTAENFISHSYNNWITWDKESKILFNNILYMHSRSPSYEWDWERFTIEYMVFDCCVKLARNLNIYNIKDKEIRSKGHRFRMKSICDEFKIPYEQELIDDIVELRNTLFHEALWDYYNPRLSLRFSKYNQLYDYNLRRLNQRIIPYLLGYHTQYINTGWHYLGTLTFDKPNV